MIFSIAVGFAGLTVLVGDREERELVLNLKRASKRLIKRLPDQGRFVKSTLLKLQMRKEVIASNLYRRVGLSRLPNAFQVYWVHPSRIKYHTNLENSSPDWEDWVFDQGQPIARVRDGDWDKPLRRVSDMRVFRAIEERIRHGVSWESTDFYKDAVRQIEGGRELWMCSDRASFSRRCDDIDRLIDSMSSAGMYMGRCMRGMVEARFPGAAIKKSWSMLAVMECVCSRMGAIVSQLPRRLI